MNEHGAPAEQDAAADHDARRWACATLGVAEDAPADAVRAAFLKQVGEDDFFPSPDTVVAWQTLAAQAAPFESRTARVAQRRANDALRAPVERFAERFFDLVVAERVREWADLRGRCHTSAALAARLEGLSAGLHMDRQAALAEVGGPPPATAELPPAPPSRERILAERLFELFPLRPVDRAERQQEWMQAWQEELKEWQATARVLKRRFPKVAALDAELIDVMLNPPKPAKASRRAVSRVAETDYRYENATHPPARGKKPGLLWTLAVFTSLVLVSLFSRFNDEPGTNNPINRSQTQPAIQRRPPEMQQPMAEEQEPQNALRSQSAREPLAIESKRKAAEEAAADEWRKQQRRAQDVQFWDRVLGPALNAPERMKKSPTVVVPEEDPASLVVPDGASGSKQLQPD